MNIGNFEHNTDSNTYVGDILTLDVGINGVTFKPRTPKSAKDADYRIHASTTLGEVEIGSAWKKTGEKGAFLSVLLDSPFRDTALNCALFRNSKGGFDLVWNRQKKAKTAASEA